MPIDKQKQFKDAYVIVPLYCISVNDSDLPITCGEWQLIDIEYFYKKYANKVFNGGLLKEDVPDYGTESLKYRSMPKYLLVKEIKLFKGNSLVASEKNSSIENRASLEIDLFITICRLMNKGRILINRIYICSIDTEYSKCPKTSTLLDNIYIYKSCGKSMSQHFDRYLLNQNALQQAFDFLPTVKKCYKQLEMPLVYFNRYFNSSELYDMIINLLIVLETTILSGKDSNLKQTLVERGTCLFGAKRGAILNLAYEIRSDIVYYGSVADERLVELREIIGSNYVPRQLVFSFIKYYLEPIARDIINYFLSEVDKDETQSIQAIATKI